LPISITPPTTELHNWALNKVLAGNRGITRTLEVSRSGQNLSFKLEAGRFDRQYAIQHDCRLETRWLSPDYGYISFNDSLGDGSTVFLFDAALEELSAAKGLVLDLRRAGGGNTGVLEGIAGRLVASRVAYQRTVRPAGEAFISYLEPRGNSPYLQPIVLLVGPWTGSAGEGLAISLSAMARARTVGLKMAGLEGGVFHRRMPRTGLGFQLTGEKIYNGTIKNGSFCSISRQAYQPDKLVDLTSRANRHETDYVLKVGVTVLNDLIKGTSA
ncbi:MAG: S41 family peptidase, partial [Chloroflexota bacterium]|nr:S41 family peptidase [Chloroflexota bacterium]